MRAFTDRSDGERLAFIGAVDAAGGAMGQYHGRYVQVCIPRVDWTPRGSHDAASVSIRQTADGLRLIDSIAQQFGLVRDDEGHFFPLGSDKPAAQLRHHGPAYCGYDAAPGYWYYVSYRPADEATPDEARTILAELHARTSATPGPVGEVPFSLTAPVGTGGGKQKSLF